MKEIIHVDEALSTLDGNVKRALTALGLKGVEKVVDKMQNGYHDRHKTYVHTGGSWTWNGDYHTEIWMSGDLQRSITSEVENSGKDSVDIGTNLRYAQFVHDGTYKLAARPFLRDGIQDNIGELTEIAASYLSQGL